MKRMTKLALILAALLVPVAALAQPIVRTSSQTESWVDCTTTSGTLLAAATGRNAVMFLTTSSTAVYIHSGSDAATSANSMRLVNGVTWTDEVGSVYDGAFTCLAASGTVSVNIVRRP